MACITGCVLRVGLVSKHATSQSVLDASWADSTALHMVTSCSAPTQDCVSDLQSCHRSVVITQLSDNKAAPGWVRRAGDRACSARPKPVQAAQCVRSACVGVRAHLTATAVLPCLPGRGVAKFEHYCAKKDIEGVSFDVLSKLYEDPNNLDALPNDKLKLLARSMIQQTMDERCGQRTLLAGCASRAQHAVAASAQAQH